MSQGIPVQTRGPWELAGGPSIQVPGKLLAWSAFIRQTHMKHLLCKAAFASTSHDSLNRADRNPCLSWGLAS